MISGMLISFLSNTDFLIKTQNNNNNSHLQKKMFSPLSQQEIFRKYQKSLVIKAKY